jgi:5-methyltetrahydrofolate--homocysteine methyltransferase
MFDLQRILSSIVAGNQYEVAELTRSALAEGVDPAAIVDTAYIPAMDLVGDQFSRGDIFVPEMLRSARAMKTGMEIIKPCYSSHAEHAKATVVICTVKGDLHDIGKNLVAMMLEGSGVKVIDMGVDVDCERVIGNVQEYHPDFLVMSALLTTTMISMEKTVHALVRAGLRDKVKVLVGGAPVSQEFADSIGADGYGRDAGEAVKLVRRLGRQAAG